MATGAVEVVPAGYRARAMEAIRRLQERVAQLEAEAALSPAAVIEAAPSGAAESVLCHFIGDGEYLVIPARAVAEADRSWRNRLAVLLRELHETTGYGSHLPDGVEYTVRLRDRSHSRLVSVACDPLR